MTPVHSRVATMWERLLAIVCEEGVSGLASRGWSFAPWALRRRGNDGFDSELGVDTAGQVPVWNLGVSSANAKFASRYAAVNPSAFRNALAHVDLEPSKFSFIDLGCGKGRALILAAQRGFKRVVGVEFAPGLAAIARKNLERTGLAAEVVEGDVCQYRFPNDNLLVYMYNPFGSVVMVTVIKNLLDWVENCRHTAYVFYLTDIHHKLFESEHAFELVARRDDFSIWRLR